jgi:uncharacterized membrane protein
MLRKLFIKKNTPDRDGFHFRGHDIKRIETFSDAVFAFAVTLLIVSLEVPRSFEELLVSMRGFWAFGTCFCFLMLIWHEQHVFFRRYGLEDTATVVLNSILLFIVLFYVYPLKFLFTLIFTQNMRGVGHSLVTIKETQIPNLMIIYGTGYITIYFLFFLLYGHAFRNKTFLQLNDLEIFDTRTKMYVQLILVAVGSLSILLACLLPSSIAGLSGYAYMLLAPGLWIYHSRRGKSRRKIIADLHPQTV